MTDELTLLREADPARALTQPRELDQRALADLRAFTTSASGPKVRAIRLWSWVAAAVAAAAVLGAVVLGLPGGGPAPRAFAATPPLLAVSSMTAQPGALLEDLADRAQAAPGSADTGTELIRTQSWSLFTRVEGKTVTSAVVPIESELRWRADRSGTLKTVTGQPYFPNQASHRAWAEASQPAKPGTVITTQVFAPGGFSPMWSSEPPTAPQELADYLAIGHPISDLGTAELFVAIGDLARERQLSPAQRAAILRGLAKAPDVQVLGTVRDRLDRAGIAVATDSNYSGLMTRYILVFDPTTGALDAQEAWLTTSAGTLNVAVPSVISYTAWRH